MSSTMLNIIYILIIIVFFGAIVYSIYNANKISRENRAKEEMYRKMLLAEVEGKRDNNLVTSSMEASENNINITKKETGPITLDYDNIVDDTDVDTANGKRLKDFFDET